MQIVTKYPLRHKEHIMTESDKYKLSTYEVTELLSTSSRGKIEKVVCSLDGVTYCKRVLFSDKRAHYAKLRDARLPHVPRIHEVFFGENTVVIEQFIHGARLDKLRESLSAKQTRRIALQVLEAIAGLHRLEIIHRDIKPENILIDEDENAWLIDFDIARFYREDEDRDTVVLGTRGFAPPEQYGFAQTDYRSDIYAYGKTLEALLPPGKANLALRRFARYCANIDPTKRPADGQAALRSWRARRIMHSVGLAAIAPLVVGAGIFLLLHADFYEKEPQILATTKPEAVPSQSQTAAPTQAPLPNDLAFPQPELRIIKTPDSSYPALSLQDGEEKRGNAEGLTVVASFTESTLALRLSDDSAHSAEYVLRNTLVPEYYDYPHVTAWEAEVLLYDFDGDDYADILVALSNREKQVLLNGHEQYIGNYCAAWIILYKPEKGFILQEGVAFDHWPSFQLDETMQGILLCESRRWNFAYYYLENGALVFNAL